MTSKTTFLASKEKETHGRELLRNNTSSLKISLINSHNAAMTSQLVVEKDQDAAMTEPTSDKSTKSVDKTTQLNQPQLDQMDHQEPNTKYQ